MVITDTTGTDTLDPNASGEMPVADDDVLAQLVELNDNIGDKTQVKAGGGVVATVIQLLKNIDNTQLASLIAQLPATLGQKASASSLATVLSSEQQVILTALQTALEKIDDLQGALKSVDTDELISRITDSAGTEINPAKEDGNLASILTAAQAIQTAVEIIDNAISGNEMQVDVITSALPAGAATNAKLDEIKVLIGEVQANPTENTVLDRLKDLLTGIVLATGANVIGKLAANSGVDIGDVTINNSTAEPIPAGGNVAHDGVDSGNPVKIGGKYRATPVQVGDGDRDDILTDGYGRVRVWSDSQLDPGNDEVLISGNDGDDGAGTNRTIKTNSKGSSIRGRNITVTSGTWTGDNSLTTAIADNFRLCNITVHYDAAITNNCTVTLDANDGANYDTVLRTADNSGGETDNNFEFEDGSLSESGDEIVVACNVGANNAYCRIVTEEY